MAVAFRTGFGNDVNGVGCPVIIAAPAVAGDFALAIHASSQVSDPVSGPTGWTQLGSGYTTASERTSFWYKVLASGDIGATTTWSVASAGKHAVAVAVYAGVDNANPIGGAATPITYSTSSASRLTPVFAYTALAIEMAATKGTDPGVWTVPASHTSRVQRNQAASGAMDLVIADSSTALSGGNTFSTATALAQATTTGLWLTPAAGTPPPPPSPGSQVYSWVGGQTQTGFRVNSKVSSATSVRLAYSTASNMSSPSYVAAQTPDGTGRVKHVVTGLTPNTRYYYQLADTPAGGSESLIGSVGTVMTPQTAGTPVASRKIIFGGCTLTNSTSTVAFTNAVAYNPDYGIFNGDFAYSGSGSTTQSVHEAVWENQIANVANLKEFIAKGCASYYCRSDHDSQNVDNGDSNNAWTQTNINAYKAVVPYGTLLDIGGTTHALDQKWQDGRFGFYLADQRNVDRSTGTNTDDATKTMLGANQKARVKDWLANDTSALKVLILDTAVMGPSDTVTKPDAWWSYRTEWNELMAAPRKGSLLILHGDSHLLGYATPSDNHYGGVPVLCAAGYDQTGGGRNTSQFTSFWNNSSGPIQQYGRLTLTDNGANIGVQFSGWDAAADTQRVAYSYSIPTSSTPQGAFLAFV